MVMLVQSLQARERWVLIEEMRGDLTLMIVRNLGLAHRHSARQKNGIRG